MHEKNRRPGRLGVKEDAMNKKTYVSLRGSVILPIVLICVIVPASVIGAQKTVPPEAVKRINSLSDALAQVVDVVRPAVVNISTVGTATMNENPFGDQFNDPFFRHFFGDQFGGPGQQRKYKTAALGSGVLVSDNGYILTNDHVIKGAEQIKVLLYDKREFRGKVIGADSKTDLAVVKIDAKDLPFLKLGDSGKMKAGDIVLAIGNPFALNQTVTMGIVSAVGRANLGLSDFEDFIQTDAAINPGNSGGALVNAAGELIGINTAIFSTSGGYMGIGFSIPSDMAKTVLDSIIKHGRVIRGWLGVSIQDLTPELAKSLGVAQQAGAVVADVMKGSPADKAGFQRGDVITAFNNKPAVDSTNLRNMVAGTAPGTTVRMTVIRNGKEQTITAKLEEFKSRTETARKAEYNNMLRGVVVEDLSARLREHLGSPGNVSGVAVTAISPDSPAQQALQPGDVILEVDRKAIRSIDEYDRVVSRIGPHDNVLLLLYRNGTTIYITIGPR